MGTNTKKRILEDGLRGFGCVVSGDQVFIFGGISVDKSIRHHSTKIIIYNILNGKHFVSTIECFKYSKFVLSDDGYVHSFGLRNHYQIKVEAIMKGLDLVP